MATKEQLLSAYKKVEDAERKLMFTAQDLSRIVSDYLAMRLTQNSVPVQR